jgi:hypothetical protein
MMKFCAQTYSRDKVIQSENISYLYILLPKRGLRHFLGENNQLRDKLVEKSNFSKVSTKFHHFQLFEEISKKFSIYLIQKEHNLKK